MQADYLMNCSILGTHYIDERRMNDMAKGSKTKLQKTKESLKKDIKINTNVKIDKIKPDEEKQRLYYCSCCGKSYKRQKGNFSVSYSPLFAGNNGYVTICNRCRDQYFSLVTDFFSGNEERAIDRMCSLFDWYYEDSAVASTRKISADRSRIGAYPSKMCLTQIRDKGTTYLDTIRDRQTDIIESEEHLNELKEDGKVSISNATIERWGLGCFSDADYKTLDDHYKMLKRQNPNCDNNQEIFIKDLCYIKLQQLNAMKQNDVDDFDKLTKLYRSTFQQAGLKTVQETDSSNDETLGVTLATISQYTPEEYYKDKKLYKDFEDLGEYITRFMFRPLKNLMTGSKDRDSEYCVKDGDDYD
jgi:hypothetical protein